MDETDLSRQSLSTLLINKSCTSGIKPLELLIGVINFQADVVNALTP